MGAKASIEVIEITGPNVRVYAACCAGRQTMRLAASGRITEVEKNVTCRRCLGLLARALCGSRSPGGRSCGEPRNHRGKHAAPGEAVRW